jgi:hypothetical protein
MTTVPATGQFGPATFSVLSKKGVAKRGFQARATSTTYGRCTMPENPAGASDTIYLAPSGKSPAYLHHRKNFESPRREPAVTFSFEFPVSGGSRGRTILPRERQSPGVTARLSPELHCRHKAADPAQNILKVSATSNVEAHKKSYPNGKNWE